MRQQSRPGQRNLSDGKKTANPNYMQMLRRRDNSPERRHLRREELFSLCRVGSNILHLPLMR